MDTPESPSHCFALWSLQLRMLWFDYTKMQDMDSKCHFWFHSNSVPGSPASTATNIVETSTVDYF